MVLVDKSSFRDVLPERFDFFYLFRRHLLILYFTVKRQLVEIFTCFSSHIGIAFKINQGGMPIFKIDLSLKIS